MDLFFCIPSFNRYTFIPSTNCGFCEMTLSWSSCVQRANVTLVNISQCSLSQQLVLVTSGYYLQWIQDPHHSAAPTMTVCFWGGGGLVISCEGSREDSILASHTKQTEISLMSSSATLTHIYTSALLHPLALVHTVSGTLQPAAGLWHTDVRVGGGGATHGEV